MYDSILLALVEIRQLLLSLHLDIPNLISSDASVILTSVLDTIATLFHKRFLSRPLIPSSEALRRKYKEKEQEKQGKEVISSPAVQVQVHQEVSYHTIPYHTIPYHTIPYHIYTIPHHSWALWNSLAEVPT